MRKLYYEKVRTILEECPEARSDDNLLFAKLVNDHDESLSSSDRAVLDRCFSDWRSPFKYDTVRRTRQKLQEEHPELRPSAHVVRGRFRRAEEIVDELRTEGGRSE